MTRSERLHDVEDLVEWPGVAYTIGLALLTPLVLLQLSDLFHLAVESPDTLAFREVGRVAARWVLGLGLATYAAVLTSIGFSGAFLSFIGWLQLIYVAENFRCDYIRPGTFDFYEYPKGSWMTPALVGIGLGLLIGAFARLRGVDWRSPLSERTFKWVWIMLLVLSADVFRRSMFNSDDEYSAFAPTRQWPLLVSLAVFLLLHVIVVRTENARS